MSKDYSNNFLVCLKSATDKRLPLIATYRLLTHNRFDKRWRANSIIRFNFIKPNKLINKEMKIFELDGPRISGVFIKHE